MGHSVHPFESTIWEESETFMANGRPLVKVTRKPDRTWVFAKRHGIFGGRQHAPLKHRHFFQIHV